jgi:hypothetical protein
MGLTDYIGKYWAGAEVIYAVIIAMTFTSVLRGYVAIPKGAYFNIVYSALFCCIAWGLQMAHSMSGRGSIISGWKMR